MMLTLRWFHVIMHNLSLNTGLVDYAFSCVRNAGIDTGPIAIEDVAYVVVPPIERQHFCIATFPGADNFTQIIWYV